MAATSLNQVSDRIKAHYLDIATQLYPSETEESDICLATNVEHLLWDESDRDIFIWANRVKMTRALKIGGYLVLSNPDTDIFPFKLPTSVQLKKLGLKEVKQILVKDSLPIDATWEEPEEYVVVCEKVASTRELQEAWKILQEVQTSVISTGD